ncbi:hypothetical protein PsYK624_139190 [Phanerochaete sordida]|uniref:F-box domain-containing protein n=1 Tax=Phanerochaete sordida TaxID=48140 RepID=A0A9P3GKS5_9APHY|nr:hypothetical protein PsYK624_139190 [Phanerochaete sordida]
MDALPEEILREILAYIISVYHPRFLRFYNPFEFLRSRRRQPSRCADVLLVSKRWLRVGTPLLYECLVLSKSEHTKSVADLIHAHPGVGQAVRCLKLAGGLGKELLQVAEHTTQVQSVFVNLRLKSSDSIVGLRKGLPLLSPIHLYVDRASYRENKRIDDVRALLSTMIKDVWPSLRTVTLADAECCLDRGFADALGRSSVEEFSCRTYDIGWLLHAGYMQKILSNPRLRSVVFRGGVPGSLTKERLQESGIDPAAIERIKYLLPSTTPKHGHNRFEAEVPVGPAVATATEGET